MLQSIHVRGYRSLREFRLKPARVTVVNGGNGVGKSNVYRALALLQRMAEGRFADLITLVPRETQILIVTHSQVLADSLTASCDAKNVELVSHEGETRPKDHAGAKRAWSFE